MKLNQFMEIEKIEELMKNQRNKRDYERLLAICLLMNGAKPDDFQNKPNTTKILAPPNTKATIDVSYNPKQGIKAFVWNEMFSKILLSLDSHRTRVSLHITE